ncbi:MAG: copper transporter [Gaiellales bacterium]
MFTWRYHVASLAAVFLALAVGILLGVAVSGKVSDATEALNADERDRLSQELEQTRESADLSDRRREAAENLVERAYPALIDRRLEEKRFAIVFLGPVQGDVRSAVERTLADAGSGRPGRLIALDTPIDVQELDEVLVGDETLATYAEEGDTFTDLGEALGRELIEQGESPLWGVLSAQLVEERSGTSSLAVDGAVVIRSWQAPSSDNVDQAKQARATTTLLDGLVEGLKSGGFPVIGVETLAALGEESQVDLYRQQGISSVDNVDTLAGRLALAVLLAGGQPGHYGLKDSATDGVTPPIEPLPVEGSGG